MTDNREIEKFISNHFHTRLVRDLYQANEDNNRSAFAAILRDIRNCIGLIKEIRMTEQAIVSHSKNITELKKEKNALKQELKQLRDGHTGKDKYDFFYEFELRHRYD